MGILIIGSTGSELSAFGFRTLSEGGSTQFWQCQHFGCIWYPNPSLSGQCYLLWVFKVWVTILRAVNFSVFTTNSVGMFLMFHSSKTLFTKLLSRNFWSISRYFPSILESGCLARAEECLLMSVPAKLHFFPRARQMLRMIFIKAQYVSNVDVLFSQTSYKDIATICQWYIY